MVLDSIRTLVIWTVSLAVGWQVFHALQLLGFGFLVVGMCIYNDILIGNNLLNYRFDPTLMYTENEIINSPKKS